MFSPCGKGRFLISSLHLIGPHGSRRNACPVINKNVFSFLFTLTLSTSCFPDWYTFHGCVKHFSWCEGIFSKKKILSILPLWFGAKLCKTSCSFYYCLCFYRIKAHDALQQCPGNAIAVHLVPLQNHLSCYVLFHRPGWMDISVAIDFNVQHLRHTQHRSTGPPESRAALPSLLQSVWAM